MADSFEKRQKGFETKWAHDEELRFKIYARRNKLLGVWAAAEMGLTGSDVETYAKEVIVSDFEKPGDDDVFVKVLTDFNAKGIALSDHLIRRKMDDLLEEAKTQIEREATP